MVPRKKRTLSSQKKAIMNGSIEFQGYHESLIIEIYETNSKICENVFCAHTGRDLQFSVSFRPPRIQNVSNQQFVTF
jgi:hypothetical protein